MKTPDKITLDQGEIEALITRVETNCLLEGDSQIIKAMADTLIVLNQALENKKISIGRLKKLLFGSKTEKTENVLDSDNNADPESSDQAADKQEDASDQPTNENGDNSDSKDKVKKKTKGHGRNGAGDYTGAPKEFISHSKLAHKDPCPLCPKGRVYKVNMPGVVVRISAQSPLQATVYELEKLRCNLCGKVFTAKAPGDLTGKHYDETAKAMIAVLRYGYGLPFNRLEQLQSSLGIPLPASTQWDKVESAGDKIYPAFVELERQAAQGTVFHNDDTNMKILDLMKENKLKDKKDRTGIFTTGIISILDNTRKIALYYTGRNHAGENIEAILKKRDPAKEPPIQMCDALSRNTTGDFDTIVSNCMSHARRGFVDVSSFFLDECRYVLETLANVYKNDAITKAQQMSPDKRLEFHQMHSTPLMENLNKWLNKQQDEKLVEPNSGLGQAIGYMVKHWPELTCFLRVPGAPIDNNVCEQSLKRAIQHRKNSLFYRTSHGAYIGDMFMSFIQTCNLMKKNPFTYLVALQKHYASVLKDPSRWMPWNYKAALALEPSI